MARIHGPENGLPLPHSNEREVAVPPDAFPPAATGTTSRTVTDRSHHRGVNARKSLACASWHQERPEGRREPVEDVRSPASRSGEPQRSVRQFTRWMRRYTGIQRGMPSMPCSVLCAAQSPCGGRPPPPPCSHVERVVRASERWLTSVESNADRTKKPRQYLGLTSESLRARPG